LAIWDLLESRFHIGIEFSERDDPLVFFISSIIPDDFLEYRPRSLAPADDEYMRLGGFPVWTLFVKRGRGDFVLFSRRNPPSYGHLLYKGGSKYRIQYLAHYFTLFWIKIFFCSFKSEKYPSCYLS
jgi:hypothetical protein